MQYSTIIIADLIRNNKNNCWRKSCEPASITNDEIILVDLLGTHSKYKDINVDQTDDLYMLLVRNEAGTTFEFM